MEQVCERCGKKVVALIMSKFNTEMICHECKKAEQAHPDYQKASRAEEAAIFMMGDFNFAGIGLPADLGGNNDS